MLKTTQMFWQKDVPKNGSDLSNSLVVLINSLSTQGIYAKWKGGDKHSGATKSTLATNIRN